MSIESRETQRWQLTQPKKIEKENKLDEDKIVPFSLKCMISPTRHIPMRLVFVCVCACVAHQHNTNSTQSVTLSIFTLNTNHTERFNCSSFLFAVCVLCGFSLTWKFKQICTRTVPRFVTYPSPVYTPYRSKGLARIDSHYLWARRFGRTKGARRRQQMAPKRRPNANIELFIKSS